MFKTFLRHGSNALLAAGILAVALAWASGHAALSPLHVLLGALLFYLSEYGWHRFVFHAPPARWPWLRRLQHRMHYDHHSEPNRLDLLFLPAWFVVPNLAATGLLAFLVLGAEPLPSLLAGIMLAILHYEWAHYVAHIPYTPRTTFGRWMKQYHLRHHFISEHHWFGVSNPALDLAAGTYAKTGAVKRSATVRRLHP